MQSPSYPLAARVQFQNIDWGKYPYMGAGSPATTTATQACYNTPPAGIPFISTPELDPRKATQPTHNSHSFTSPVVDDAALMHEQFMSELMSAMANEPQTINPMLLQKTTPSARKPDVSASQHARSRAHHAPSAPGQIENQRYDSSRPSAAPPAPLMEVPITDAVRRRSRSGSFTSERHARWTAAAAAPSPYSEHTLCRRPSMEMSLRAKRKRSFCSADPSHARKAPAQPPKTSREQGSSSRRDTACAPVHSTVHGRSSPQTPRMPAAATELPHEIVSALFDSNRARSAPCGWMGCSAPVSTSRGALRDHIERVHGAQPDIPPSSADPLESGLIQCRWRTCTQVVQWSNIARHLVSHMCTTAGSCRLCGISLSRSDTASRHIRACWARLGEDTGLARLRALGLANIASFEAGLQAKRARVH